MADETQTTHPVTTIARYFVGVYSVVGFIPSVRDAVHGYLLMITQGSIRFVGDSPVENYWALGCWASIPLGYLLVAQFCLRRWPDVMQQEGLGACRTVLIFALTFGIGGTLGLMVLSAVDVESALVTGGFYMFNGYALASVIRKWRRMKRAANAE